MALGATVEIGSPVTIVPVGINYFNGHRFRSRVFVDIGVPIVPSASMVDGYRSGGAKKRDACSELLDRVVEGLRAVTIEAPDYDTLQALRATRRLYASANTIMSAQERFALTHAFAEGYKTAANDPRVRRLRSRIDEYRKSLVRYGVSDHRVATSHRSEDIIDSVGLSVELLYRLAQILVFVVIAIPGYVLARPVFALTRTISQQKAAEAKAKSTVKIAGRDVIATWKLLTSLVVIPLAHAMYTTIAWVGGGTAVATTYFFFAPFVCFGSLLAVERGKSVANHIVPLFLSAIRPKTGERLRTLRRDLQQEVRSTIKTLGWDRTLRTRQPDLYRPFSKKSFDDDDGIEEDDLPEQWFLSHDSSHLRRRV